LFRIIINQNKMTLIIEILIKLFAGIGIGAMVDKVAADKLPAYPKSGINPATDDNGNFSMPKLLYFLAAGVIGALVWKFVSRKLKIRL
jgi:hypothetical protein